MLNKKQIWRIFLFEFKMGHKAAEKTHINNTFGPGTANECTVQWWYKKFCKGDKRLEDEKHSGQPPEVAEDLSINFSTVSWHLKQIGKVKKLDRWVPHELTANQKHLFNAFSSLILHNKEPFLDWMVICDKKWVLYDNRWWPAQWLDLEEAPEHFPKPNLHWKKVSHCLVVCCWSDPLQPSEFQQNHYIWEACSANQWDAPKTAMSAAGISQQNGPNSSPWQQLTACCITNTSKAEWIRLRSIGSSTIFTWSLSNYHFFKHLNNFLQGKYFHNQQEAENAF